MSLDPETLGLKLEALQSAVTVHTANPEFMKLLCGVDAEETRENGVEALLRTADRFHGWLSGTTALRLSRGPVVPESSEQTEPSTPVHEGDTVQINTGQKFSVEVDTEDAGGYDTDAAVEFTIDDTSVATVEVDADDAQKAWVISGAPGSAVLTVRVTDVDPPLEATLAVDVVPAGTATIELVTGDAVDENDDTTPENPTEPTDPETPENPTV